jgi:hypothetical protein
MCVQKFVKNLLVFSVFLAVFLCGCEAMDNILTSAGAYKISAQIDGVPLEECSYVKSTDKIKFDFEERVSDDPDVSTLVVFLKKSSGDISGWKVIYTLDQTAGEKEETQLVQENEKQDEEKISEDDKTADEAAVEEKKALVFKKNGDELFFPVKSLDDELPPFPIPENLSAGKYSLVLQVMNGKDILQKTEKNIYYLGQTVFSYEGINVYLPGAVDASHLIPKESVVMLEVNLNFDHRLNPYIIWYDGKNKISEGKFSDGANILFWKAPEQNGFFSLYAEVFPVEKSNELSGYKKEISLLVSSNIKNINLVSADIKQLTHWYTMEGNLNDSKNTADNESALKPGSKNKPKWMGSDGTYGLATGYNSILKLPKIPVLNKDTEIWQILIRFKSLSNGVVFSAQFGSSSDVLMFLSVEDKNLVLTLASQQKTVSQTVSLPKNTDESSENIGEEKDISFLTAGIKFSIKSGVLSAQINIIGDLNPVELTTKPITLETKIKNEFNITLGFNDDSSLARLKKADDESESSAKQKKANVFPEYNALWDEFALYYMPPADILSAALKPVTSEDQPVIVVKR